MSWWRHFESEVPNLAALGVTQVWLPPPNKAMRKEGQGYDAYDLWDLGEFYQKGTIATRWGTKEELVRAVAAARAHGIDVLIDAILNHKLGADRPEKFTAVAVDPNNRLKEIAPESEMEGWTAFDFLGRGDKTTGGAGFRFDAIKHMDRRFLLQFIKQVRETSGRPDLFSVAEYWSGNVELIKPYIRAFEGLVTFFDVPLHYNLHDASKAGSRYDLRKILDRTVLKYRPGDAVTFVDNHE
ncbi:Glucan 1,4-alpha-maltohexaosidase [Trametes pubescens]|uniref:Glucan 1,4-alpha-maltohexaosidase n=1 Tax=Trametes pubescens TaxID=154538 RepID=A0A1M2VV54_TRAPU|nr:Glucan 1,4-alpha-maltohexaosidase [Trametes pubescens]